MKETNYLGIDVSKGYAEFSILKSDMVLKEPIFQLDDTSMGHKKLGSILLNYFQNNPDLDICCGIESTGGYEKNWFKYLLTLSEKLPIKVALLNPVVVKGISKASLSRTITDDISAINIARYLISYQETVGYSKIAELENPFKTGRAIYTFHKMLVKQKVQLNNQLEKLLYQYFSESLIYCRHGIPMWLLRVLVKYPSAQKVKQAGMKRLIKIKGLGPEKARKLFEKACQNTQIADENICFIIENTCGEIIHKLDKIQKNLIHLENTYKEYPSIKLLCTITGINISSAIVILFEIEDINRFETTKQIAAYFGLNPEYRQSGDGNWGNHLSKKGRKLLRATLYMCCMAAIRHDPYMKKQYADIRAKGKCHYFAMGVLMHKMLRIIFGILKSEVPYNAAIDQKNQQNAQIKQGELKEATTKQQKENLTKKRRYQRLDIDQVPVSRRKSQSIKKLEKPQESKDSIMRGQIQLMQK